jgi:hypothetical protein
MAKCNDKTTDDLTQDLLNSISEPASASVDGNSADNRDLSDVTDAIDWAKKQDTLKASGSGPGLRRWKFRSQGGMGLR